MKKLLLALFLAACTPLANEDVPAADIEVEQPPEVVCHTYIINYTWTIPSPPIRVKAPYRTEMTLPIFDEVPANLSDRSAHLMGVSVPVPPDLDLDIAAVYTPDGYRIAWFVDGAMYVNQQIDLLDYANGNEITVDAYAKVKPPPQKMDLDVAWTVDVCGKYLD